jgi:hypothetical protein
MTIQQGGMYMKNNISWLWMFAVVLGAFACKPEKQPETRDSGVTGSEWFKPVDDKHNYWEVLGVVTGGRYYRTEMMAPDITQAIIDNSVILIYAKLYGYDEAVWPADYVGLLPTAVYISSLRNSEDKWSLGISPGKISIRLENSSNTYPTNGPDARHAFRYIIVPKNAAVTGQKPTSTNPLLQYSEQELRDLPYDQLCRMAGLKM